MRVTTWTLVSQGKRHYVFSAVEESQSSGELWRMIGLLWTSSSDAALPSVCSLLLMIQEQKAAVTWKIQKYHFTVKYLQSLASARKILQNGLGAAMLGNRIVFQNCQLLISIRNTMISILVYTYSL